MVWAVLYDHEDILLGLAFSQERAEEIKQELIKDWPKWARPSAEDLLEEPESALEITVTIRQLDPKKDQNILEHFNVDVSNMLDDILNY